MDVGLQGKEGAFGLGGREGGRGRGDVAVGWDGGWGRGGLRTSVLGGGGERRPGPGLALGESAGDASVARPWTGPAGASETPGRPRTSERG